MHEHYTQETTSQLLSCDIDEPINYCIKSQGTSSADKQCDDHGHA